MAKSNYASIPYSYPKFLPVIMKNKYTQTDESCFDKTNLISDECLNEILKEYCVKQKFPNCF